MFLLADVDKPTEIHWTLNEKMPNEISKILEPLDIQVVPIEKPSLRKISDDSIDLQIATIENLQIFRASESAGHHPHHFIFLYEDRSLDWEDLSLEQLKTLAKTMTVADEVLQKQLGYPATLFMSHQGRRLPHRWVMEILPRGIDLEHQNEVDLEEKLKHFDRFFFGYPSSKECTKQIRKTTLSIDQLFANTIAKKLDSEESPKPFAPFMKSVSHKQGAVLYLVQKLYDELGAKVRPVSLNNNSAIPDQSTFPVLNCLFCNPSVLQNQLIFQGIQNTVLFNYKPWSEDHFMVLPKEHKQYWKDLTLEEKVELLSLVQTLVKGVKKKQGDVEVFTLIQNGVAAGQTVPHMHIHVLTGSNQLQQIYRLLKEISGTIKPLPPEYMHQKKVEFDLLIK